MGRQFGNTPLNIAAYNGRAEAVERLVAAKCNIDEPNQVRVHEDCIMTSEQRVCRTWQCQVGSEQSLWRTS